METGDIGRGPIVAGSSEARADALFAQAVIGLCEATLDGTIVRVNREFCRMTGYAPEALVSRHLNHLVALEGADAWMSCVELVLTDFSPCSLHHTFVQPTGRTVVAHSSLSCVKCDDRPCGILLVSHDITDREPPSMRAQTVRRSGPAVSEHAERLLENITDVVVSIDAAWRFNYVNSAAERFFKKDRETLLGHVCWDIFPELRAHSNSRAMERAMVERQSYAWESLSKLSGQWTQWRCYPLPDGGLFTLIQNIDDRVRAERALRASERLFQALADLVPPMIWTLDAHGNPLWCNRRWLTYVGAPALTDTYADMLGRLHPADRAATRVTMRRALEAGRPFQLEHRIRGADGIYRWYVVQLQPIADIHGEVVQWIAVGTEIHAQREALAAEQSARADAEQRLDEVRRSFAELPLMLGVFRGPEHTIHAVTERASRLLARPLVGLDVRAAFPDVDPSLFKVLDEVYATGTSRELAGLRLPQVSGPHHELTESVFDVKCHALSDASGRIAGVIAWGLEVADEGSAQGDDERFEHDGAPEDELEGDLLEELGLHAALTELLQVWSDHTGVHADFQASWLLRERLPDDVEAALYGVIEQALVDVARYAQATRVNVVVARLAGSVIAVVEDDGVGLDPGPPPRHGRKELEEHVALAGGSLEIESEPGGGTTIFARLPLPAADADSGG